MIVAIHCDNMTTKDLANSYQERFASGDVKRKGAAREGRKGYSDKNVRIARGSEGRPSAARVQGPPRARKRRIFQGICEQGIS